VTHCDSISKQEGRFGNSLLAQMERAWGKGNVTVADLGLGSAMAAKPKPLV